MTIFNADEIRAALETAFPVPMDEYEDAFYCQLMAGSLNDLAKVYKRRFNETVDEIKAGGLLSEDFVLVQEESRRKEVDIKALRNGLPDLFQEVVHVTTSDAAKLLSNRFIYEAVKKKIGDRITDYDAVNVDDLEARLPEPELSEYMKIITIPKGYVVKRVSQRRRN
ncbi:hypothetical protein Mlab_0697 [Methanocorpusculum labreanum Z]|uniref:Uncharacterized protein n=1 Tax=Methanocorpusculum labreanum (strain ATCC 43576 / DSM 4855 / Z) TaxID=410358 RepID=A2SRB3_METLZ|nr:hypothetical protein [Methanocorpusculum labreanum]ABN06869.1 hypothetical protein Mlab_0697 [Methanocorpusculum labreanum Z]